MKSSRSAAMRLTFTAWAAGVADSTGGKSVSEAALELAGETLRFGDLELDPAAHRVRRDGEAIKLGPTEFRLLRFFLEHPGRVFSRAQLLDAVWGNASEVEERTVDVHIRRLRKALGDTATE
mgnify:CR=1 FL=1